MREKNILFAFNGISDEYVESARPGRKRRPLARWALIAACVMLVCGLSLWSVAMGRGGSDYVQNPGFLAAMQDYLLNSGSSVIGVAGSAPGDPEGDDGGVSPNGDYLEITDNQVEGIVEGDLAKATEKYLFRLGSHTIYIYSISGEDSALISTYTIPYIKGEKTYSKYFDMFLSSDGCTLTLFCEYDGDNELAKTIIMSIDVSDVTSPREKSRVVINGSPAEVRRIGDEFYLITNWLFEKNRVDLDAPESFIPSIDYADGKHICQSDKIIFPEQLSRLYYRYLTVLDEDSLQLSDELAMMVLGNVYFSESSIIFDSQYTKSETEGDETVSRCYSTISVLDISDGLNWRGDFTVKGWAKDQYSFDERDGVLRIVASLSDRAGYIVRYDSASLYVYDLDTMSEIASVEEFAPYGEGATAVRFEGDRLYVCTAEVATYTDPVYFFDLSDYSNITYADTGFITGFSSSLIDLGEGYLLGIGREDGSTIKLEAYRREGDGVISVDKLLFSGSISTDYKSYLINREENLFGFGISGYPKEGSDKANLYFVVRLEDERLTVVSEIKSSDGDERAFYNNGYVYFTLPDVLRVADVNRGVVVNISTSHQTGEWTTLTPASCGEREILEAKCSCGRVKTKTNYSSYSEFVDHLLEDGICTLCGKDLGSAKKNRELLIYTSNGDGTCTVTGSRERLVGVVEIPKYSPKGEPVNAIGRTAFMYSGITEISLPDSILLIDDYAFYFCRLTSIDLKNTAVIGECAFTQCEGLTEVAMNDGLTRIGKGAFGYCESLTEVIIPDSVTEIGAQAFTSCESLSSVRLPAGLTKISQGLFNLCQSLEKIDIPDSVTLIEAYGFNYCTSLTEVVIPDGVTSLGDRAFGDCRSLTQIQLGKGVESIGDEAFDDCVRLVEVINRSSLDIKAGSQEHGGIALYAKSVTKDDSALVTVGDYLFLFSDGKNQLLAYTGDETEITLPTLEDGAEYEIGSYAFYDNEKLTAVTVPDCVTAIGDYAFGRCKGISYMSLPYSVSYIGDYAFVNCYFTAFDMGDGVVEVGSYAFNGCGKLISIAMSRNLKVIGDYAFDGCYALADLVLPDSLEAIGVGAFGSCRSIQRVYIPYGVKIIEDGTFNNCKSLVQIFLHVEITKIGDAFLGSYNIKYINYEGSREQWEQIDLSRNNGLWEDVTVIYNY